MGSRNSKPNNRQLLDDFYYSQRAKKYEQTIHKLLQYQTLNLTRCNLTQFPDELIEYIEQQLIVAISTQQHDHQALNESSSSSPSSPSSITPSSPKVKNSKNKKKGSDQQGTRRRSATTTMIVPTEEQVKNFTIKDVSLASNQIKEWPFAAFLKLHGYGVLSVEEIHSAYSCLECIDSTMFDWGQVFPQLQKLFLFANHIERMPESLGSCMNLVTVDLRSNPCIDVEQFIPFLTDRTKCQIKALKSLKLSSCYNYMLETKSTVHVPCSLLELHQQLSVLDISLNRIESFCRGLDASVNMSCLTELDLTSNKLSMLEPNVFCGNVFPKLKTLSLVDNKLSILPDEFCTISSLEKLYLSQNELTHLPDMIDGLSSLVHVEIAYNMLTGLPASFSNIKSLAVLDLTNNRIESISNDVFASWTNLQDLFLANNNLSNETFSLELLGKHMGRLYRLNLGFNQFTSLEDMFEHENEFHDCVPQLSQLVVTGNKLTSLPMVLTIKNNLRALHAGLNELKSVPSEIFLDLKMLSLFGNELSDDSLPKGFLNADSSRFGLLTLLDLSHNNFAFEGVNVSQFYTELLNRQCSSLDVQLEFNQDVKFMDTAISNNPSDNNGSVSSGTAHTIGMRPTMEDSYILKNNLDTGSDKLHVQLYAIFDGHAGDKTVNFVSTRFTNVLCDVIKAHLSELESGVDQEDVEQKVMRLALEKMDRDVLETKYDDGCTAIVCMIINHNRCICANIGDSRIVLVRKSESQTQQDNLAQRITIDHKPRALFEKKRIRQAGSCVHDNRVNGYGVSRSIGDHAQRPAICSEAYITSFTIDPTKHQFIILACDGVWDVLKDHEAAQFVVDTWNQLPARIQEKEDYEKLSFVSAALRDFALALRSMDNISTMILKLNNIEQ